jgi:mono/diheme cytochrome c family protein
LNKIWVAAFAGCIALVIASASVASPQSSEILSFGPGRPVPPGNVLFGQDTFDAVCFACHSHDLSGGRAPRLTGAMFYKSWQGKSVDALVDFILNRMPQDDPGSLTQPMARDLAAYIVAYSNKPGNLASEHAGK